MLHLGFCSSPRSACDILGGTLKNSKHFFKNFSRELSQKGQDNQFYTHRKSPIKKWFCLSMVSKEFFSLPIKYLIPNPKASSLSLKFLKSLSEILMLRLTVFSNLIWCSWNSFTDIKMPWLRIVLTLPWRRPLSYRNQSTDLQSRANQWTGFYMITASVVEELNQSWKMMRINKTYFRF